MNGISVVPVCNLIARSKPALLKSIKVFEPCPNNETEDSKIVYPVGVVGEYM